MIRFCTAILLFFFALSGCADQGQTAIDHTGDAGQGHPPVITGAAVLLDAHLEELRGRNVGLVANPSARVNGTHLLDSLITLGVDIKALFAPEHGFRGDRPAGEEIKDGIDTDTGLPVFSLYGATRKPTKAMLDGIDLLIFDMQDVGVRFYTYIPTLGLVIEAAAEHGVEVWVLDRPNPLGGEYVSGFMLEDAHRSFVGMFPVPVAHGLTMGEMANMMVAEGWIHLENGPELKIIQMKNWERNRSWTETGHDWRAPSPNLPHFTNALVYPGTCFIEGTTMSEGRGTRDPFMMVGSPGLAMPDSVINRLMETYPVLLQKIEFTPETIQGMAVNPKHEGKAVSGFRITPQTLDPVELKPVEFGLELIREMLRHAPEASVNRFMYNLAGTRKIDDFLKSDLPPSAFWEDEIGRFMELREIYFLY